MGRDWLAVVDHGVERGNANGRAEEKGGGNANGGAGVRVLEGWTPLKGGLSLLTFFVPGKKGTGLTCGLRSPTIGLRSSTLTQRFTLGRHSGAALIDADPAIYTWSTSRSRRTLDVRHRGSCFVFTATAVRVTATCQWKFTVLDAHAIGLGSDQAAVHSKSDRAVNSIATPKGGKTESWY